MALLLKNDVLFAHKALNLVAGISANARRVAGAILDHFNKRTAQCDPSVERLARMLGIDRATVLRATAELCDPRGANLFEKFSHGGHGNRACYRPNWDRFQDIVADWDRRMKKGNAPEGQDPEHTPCRPGGTPADPPAGVVAKLRPYTSQDCDLERRKTATQTLRRNPSKKPIEFNARAESDQKPPLSAPADTRERLLRGRSKEPSRRSQQPRKVGLESSVSPQLAATAAAERRWYSAVHALGAGTEAAVIDWITPAHQHAATEAELDRRGGGIAYLLDAMSREHRAASAAGMH